ncbi:MAG: DNA mismatch repair endonuclease MutL [Bacilli bacterium]|nr:DNA mismatch repair endonuclease MutL [Bacilli bacterium]
MSNIHIMSDSLANKIAAGEVVERIASVVKELVENSIDAGSKSIIVNLVDSGTKSIKVTDDGCGMDKEDALLSFQRHATSKIKKEDDLFFINTLGFRGEALASIASVSKVDMKTSQGSVGTHIYIEGGKVLTNEESDARKGTTIEVADLFYNTPARLKYLKSLQTELANVTAYIERLSLSHEDISFTLTNNDNKIVYTSGSGDLLKVIHEIYGYTVSSNMIHVEAYNDDYDISGYICKPTVLKSSKSHMNVIVNGRVVSNNTVNRAINEGYFKFKPDIKYPVVVLKIDTDPTLIDVNIHPSKNDIKFSKIEGLSELITTTINDALTNTLLVKEVEEKLPTIVNRIEEKVEDKTDKEFIDNSTQLSFVEEVVDKKDYKEVEIKVNTSSEKKESKNEEIRSLVLRPIAIVHKTYIIAESDDGYYIIDQHAAHERINYERVKKDFAERKINRTSMLIPLTIELSTSDFIKIKERLNVFDTFGFTIEEFGLNTIVVKEHPTWLRSGYEDETINKIIELIINEKDFDDVKFNDRLIATIACKSSVRANEEISLEQADQILKDLVLCDNPYNCAHGRPTIIHYSNYELERMFKRVMN